MLPTAQISILIDHFDTSRDIPKFVNLQGCIALMPTIAIPISIFETKNQKLQKYRSICIYHINIK